MKKCCKIYNKFLVEKYIYKGDGDMKKFFALLFLSFLIFIAMSWSDRKIIEACLDDKIANYVMQRQEQAEDRDVYEDLNSGKYQQGDKFLLRDYAEDLGYHIIKFPKYDDETILILRYGPRKVIIKNNEKIEITINGDEWGDGLVINLKPNNGEYTIYCGEKNPVSKIDNDKILQVASTLVNLRTSDTLKEMALKNRNDFERFLTTPNTLKGFS